MFLHTKKNNVQSMSTTSTTSGNNTTNDKVTSYMHTTLENYNDFNRTLQAKLDQHADKLTSVAYDGKIALSVKIKLKQTYKSIGENFDAAVEAEHLKEQNKTAYQILIAAIGHSTTRKHFENNSFR